MQSVDQDRCIEIDGLQSFSVRILNPILSLKSWAIQSQFNSFNLWLRECVTAGNPNPFPIYTSCWWINSINWYSFFRKIELNFRSSAIQVQVIGILVSIMGAVVAEFIKGPLIRPSSHPLRHTNNKQLLVFSSTPEFWVLGGILLVAASFSVALGNFIQVLYNSFSFVFFIWGFFHFFPILKNIYIKFNFWIFEVIKFCNFVLFILLERNC